MFARSISLRVIIWTGNDVSRSMVGMLLPVTITLIRPSTASVPDVRSSASTGNPRVASATVVPRAFRMTAASGLLRDRVRRPTRRRRTTAHPGGIAVYGLFYVFVAYMLGSNRNRDNPPAFAFGDVEGASLLVPHH